MTTFTRTWDASYEASPANTQSAKQGAARIREIKVDVKERGEVDHSWGGDADDGKHKKITFVDPLGAKPTLSANEGALYTKDVSSKAELFFEDEDGNETQLTSGGGLNETAASVPSGAKMLFQQTSAPTGWTKDTSASLNNTGLRVVTGTAGSGGNDNFTDVFGTGKSTDGHTITAAEMPAHRHFTVVDLRTTNGLPDVLATEAMSRENDTGSNNTYDLEGSTTEPTLSRTSQTGSGNAHSHNLSNLDLKYTDVIIATKD